MPTSVAELFESSHLSINGPVKWGEQILVDKPGVYVVSISKNPQQKKNNAIQVAPIDLKIINKWLLKVKTLKLEGLRSTSKKLRKPTPDELRQRLSKFWLPDEVILYIGQTTKDSIKERIRKFYRHELGKSSPHSGGHWLKTIKILEKLNIFWGLSSVPEKVEYCMLCTFVKNVSSLSKRKLYDPCLPLPFANLELTKDNRKKHGIRFPTIKY